MRPILFFLCLTILISCKNETSTSANEINASQGTQATTWKSKFPLLWSVAYAGETEPDPTTISYNQFLAAVTNKITQDSNFVASVKGEVGPVGPQGPQGEQGLMGPAGPKGEDAIKDRLTTDLLVGVAKQVTFDVGQKMDAHNTTLKVAVPNKKFFVTRISCKTKLYTNSQFNPAKINVGFQILPADSSGCYSAWKYNAVLSTNTEQTSSADYYYGSLELVQPYFIDGTTLSNSPTFYVLSYAADVVWSSCKITAVVY